MEKVCIFCGEKPQLKNNEHIIPMWLIEITGNPKRIAHFGYNQYLSEMRKARTFSFNAFKFPSCETCNQKYSYLEMTVKSIMNRILADDSISSKDFSILLDWFDKVRVGLWLGFQYLDKNPVGITPKFHIEKRIGVNDRMLGIFKADGDTKRLNFAGCDLLSFRYTPSCFSLQINNYCFINISYHDLFSRRIGFPYPVESFMLPDDEELSLFTSGRNRIMRPLLKKRFNIRGTELYQPMFRYRTFDPQAGKYYDTQYVRENSMVWERGVGKVFIESSSQLQEYPDSPSKIWLPSKTYEPQVLPFEMQILTLQWQTYVDDLAPSVKKLPQKDRQRILRLKSLKRKHNTKIMEIIRKKAQEIGLPRLQ